MNINTSDESSSSDVLLPTIPMESLIIFRKRKWNTMMELNYTNCEEVSSVRMVFFPGN